MISFLKKNSPLFLLVFAIACTPNKNNDSAKELLNKDSIKTTQNTEKENAPIYNGIYEEKHRNGVLKIKGEYAGGLHQGQWFAWYENGNIWSECFYKNGLKHGANTVYYENEQKRYEAFFENDKPTGTWKFYDETGKLVEEKKYE